MDVSKFTKKANRGPTCSVGRALYKMDDETRSYALEVLNHPDTQWTLVQEHSEEEFGFRISATAASRHMRGKCACE